MIKIRERMEIDGVWYALGAFGQTNTVVIVENGQTAQYFFSNNSGKKFRKMNSRKGGERHALTANWPAGAKPKYDSVKSVRFFGQSSEHRKCTELRRYLAKLGYLANEKPRGSSTKTVHQAGDSDLAAFPRWFQQTHKRSVCWSRNLGNSQELVYELDCPGFGKFRGQSTVSKQDAKLRAIAEAALEVGYSVIGQ